MDAVLTVVAIVLIVAVPFDWYVAARFIAAAAVRPHYRVLTLAALRSGAIAIAATLAGILGLQSIYFQVSGGDRLIPAPVGIILLAVALIVISLPNVYALRWLASDDEEGEA